MKICKILDQDDGTFVLEYDSSSGKKNAMRLDAANYKNAIREAKSFLELDNDNVDPDGVQWEIE